MKIALVRKDYTRKKGGAEGYAVALSLQLAVMGHEVHVFANRIDAADTEEITFHEVTVPKLRTFFKHVWFAKNVEKMLREEEFDVINGLSRIWHQDIYRVGDPLFKHWLNCHNPNFIDRIFGNLNPKQRVLLSLERRIFESPMLRRIIAISELDKRLLQEYYGLPEEKIRVIYNGVDHTRFRPENRTHRDEILAGYGIPEDRTIILFVGMDFKRKGLAYLIESLALLGSERDGVRLLVVSNDNPKKYVQLARRAGVDDIIVFAPATTEIHKVYGAADIFVFPTLYDPFANVHLEALATGLPTITTASAGGAEIVSKGTNGFVLSSPQAVEEMAERIREMLNTETRKQMSLNAVESVKDFTVERNAREVAALYEEVAAEKRG